MRRLLCLNQFVPPDHAPTAVLLEELREGLAARGWEIDMVGGGRPYRAGKPKGFRRWIAELQCHLTLVWRSLRTRRPSVILCLTDPPALPFTATLIARIRRAKLVHWAMDVYPEVAAALGEIMTESLVYRVVHAAVKSGYDQSALVACLDEDMADLIGVRHDPRLMLCPPWPPRRLALPDALPEPSSGRIRWFYSGNLGRAHEFETLLQAQRHLEEAHAPFDLVFQGGGALYPLAQQRAAELGLRHCRWDGYATEETFVASLLSANVLVASQRAETRGMLWPSKLALLQRLPRPIVWVGPADGAIARSLAADSPRHGVFAPGQHEALARWLMERRESFCRPAGLRDGSELAATLARLREEAFDLWNRRLRELAR